MTLMARSTFLYATGPRGTIRRVSVGNDGSESNGDSFNVTVSPDGRFVAYATQASNLVTDDANNADDVVITGGVSVMPVLASVGAHGASFAAGVSFVYPGSTWEATSKAPWITITNQSSTTGNGTVNYTVAPNTGGTSRTGTLTVATQTVTITQSASTNPVAQDGAFSTNEDQSVSGTLNAHRSQRRPADIQRRDERHAGHGGCH